MIENQVNTSPFITNDAVVFGILLAILTLTFYTSSLKSKFWEWFYTFFPTILVCYFVPGLLNSYGIISAETSQLDEFASKYLLPACLVYFTINIDFVALKKLGGKAVLVFLAGSLGVMVGGPLSLWIVKQISPEAVSGEMWRGLATIAGSWIGGSANQTALKEVFAPSGEIFSKAIAVDVISAELWLAILLYGVGKTASIDKWLKADETIFLEVKERIENQKTKSKVPTMYNYLLMLLIGFGTCGIAVQMADWIVPFIKEYYPELKKYSLTSTSFWVISLSTAIGLLLSQTKAKQIETTGSTTLGSLLLFILIATIGMQMNISSVFDAPILFLVGLIWISIHAIFTIVAARLLKAPYFFAAVGSQANVGGAASASVIAAAFHPALASVGVLLAILGYAIGTYLGYLTGLMMQLVAV
jgi:uncharacterized membrane protein